MNRDLFWTGMMTRIARTGAVPYNELKKLEVEEFFLIVKDYQLNG